MSRQYWRTVPRRLVWLLLWLLMATGSRPVEVPAQGGDRDAWQRVPDVISALGIDDGGWVADVGAGRGYFTAHLAQVVGATGRVFAVDISEDALSSLRRLAEDEDLQNIEVVPGEIDDPRLPARALDAVLIVDAYHEMIEPEDMLAGIYGALKPGGRLVILDLEPTDDSASRDRQMDRHRISIELAEEEVQVAGFEVIGLDRQFTTNRRGRTQWLLVAGRPDHP